MNSMAEQPEVSERSKWLADLRTTCIHQVGVHTTDDHMKPPVEELLRRAQLVEEYVTRGLG